ncbi:MAG TPA: protein kinase [Anaeromyxobacter sp.]|nr:protein kinase [Anaeromyxobacter sp.]
MPEARPPCPTCGYLADPSDGPVNFCPKCGQDLRPEGREQTLSLSLLDLVVADRYKLIAHLGEGGMGSVYKAEHIRMGKALAVKVLRGDFARDPAAVERFRSEARIVSRLSHPNTIAVFDFGEIEALGGFYLAMEYVPGRDLARVLREDGAFQEARAADIGQQILGSLAEAHEAGIVHRDMKPGNVMLMQTRPGEDFAKVLDFGIAKLRDDMSSGQTSAGSIVGTPNYLAPEQARGEPLDARSDLYAVGCLLYELLSGHPPFAGRSPMAVVNAHLHEPVPPLDRAAPGTAHRFVELVHKAVAKRPEDRFASADEMREAILDLGEPTSSRSVAPQPQVTGELRIASRSDFEEFDRQLRAIRRRRVAGPLWALAVVLGLGTLVWRFNDLYTLLAARAPALVARIPEGLRPLDHYDGEEHEPNNTPAMANRLPLPPGPNGEPAGATVVVKGTIGARLGPDTGDVDVFRIEVPSLAGPRVLEARWHADGSEDGIRGLDVTMALNRAPAQGARGSAPIVALSDRGGPGRPEQLSAPVEPGTYYLSIRERHEVATGPIEKPTDRYALEVRLVEPHPDEEVEPNDSPESAGLPSGHYAEWRAMALRNGLLEARPMRGELSPGDVDTFVVPLEGRLGLLAVLPEPGLAVSARTWTPDATDILPTGPERERFEAEVRADPGEPLLAPVHAGAAGAPPLVQLRSTGGVGAYTLLVLGPDATSNKLAQDEVRKLAEGGHLSAALELGAGVARHLPQSPGRNEVLALAGQLAQAAAPELSPSDLPRFERATRILGTAIFEEQGGALRYAAGFEQRIEGKGPVAEEAAYRLLRVGEPCTPGVLADRIEAFAARFPASKRLPEVRLLRARALEAALFDAGWKDPGLHRETTAAWERLARGPAAAEARAALQRLKAKNPPPKPPPPVCADPGER